MVNEFIRMISIILFSDNDLKTFVINYVFTFELFVIIVLIKMS